MAKTHLLFVCQQCGATHPKWMGKCEGCGMWNSLVEEQQTSFKRGSQKGITLTTLNENSGPPPMRILTGCNEFDRVCGGGLVPGSVILVGGDPGIGKSTLLLQITAALSHHHTCFYISGEEGIDQIRLRAGRLGVQESPLQLAASTQLRPILHSLESKPTCVVIDSIQTMFLEGIDSSPGTVSQVRASTQELIRVAKSLNIIIILVGHVTKEGTLAGPRVLEHMVDTVLYFEGERGHQFRILRSVKNRFGATDEIGVFEMREAGLEQVLNPSSLFLTDREEGISGAAVFSGIEGTRPVLVEIQSLVAPTSFGTPRRTVVGWDSGRLAMVTAVLEARAGLPFSGKDIYLNVAGGLRITEPAADLAVAAALVSSLTQIPIPPKTIVFGEVGLSGEVRAVNQTPARLKEASKLGFEQALTPRHKHTEELSSIMIRHVHDLLRYLDVKV